MLRSISSILASSSVGAAVAALLAGWIYPCLGATRWERCASGMETDPASSSLPLCHLDVCDLFLSCVDVLSRLVVIAALVSGIAAATWYLSRSHRVLSAGAAVALAAVLLVAMLPYAYPHRQAPPDTSLERSGGR
jgi:hypothetical protein